MPARPACFGVAVTLFAAIMAAVVAAPARAQSPAPWRFGGADISNTHASLSPNSNINSPTQINPRTAPGLKLKWSLVTSGAIAATPTVEQGALYVPDFGGSIYKVNPDTGAVIWSHKLTEYTKLYGSLSRSAPAIGTDVIVFGDNWAHDLKQTSDTGARVMAVSKATGALVWQTVIDKTSQWSQILGSPVIYGNLVYFGTTSWEEAHGKDASFVPSFRGSVVALNVATGKIVWQVFTAPPGYTGAAVPGTNPVVWPANNSLIVATGNNYSIPAKAGSCIASAQPPTAAARTPCLDPSDFEESVLALDLSTGRLLWSRQLGGPDTWTMGCQSTDPKVRAANCPYGPSNDYDFASQPNLMTVPGMKGVRDDLGGTNNGVMLGVGQKSGVYWALNPSNGGVYWSTKVTAQGGIEWGSAFNSDDHNAVYVATNNSGHASNKLVGQNGRSVTWDGGAWTSLNVITGKINWQVPSNGIDLTNSSAGGSAQGAVGFTNRVVLAGSSSGYFTALDANSGNMLWTYNSGSYVAGGASIYNETIYWGSGFREKATGKPSLFAFSVPKP